MVESDSLSCRFAQGTQSVMKWPVRRPAPSPASHGSKALAASRGVERVRRLPIERLRRLPIDVPPTLQRHMAEWGPKLRKEMAVQAGDGFSRALSTAEFSVGTDCSGLEAPVLALQAMNIPHKHAFSCDVNPKIRQYIRANMPHAKVFDDICHRDHREVPPHNIYVCGFPCQPFSVLHKNRRLLRDSRAKAFFAMLNTLRACLPALAILENVLGIRTVLGKVWGHLHALKWYEVLTFRIDPADMGEPVARPRYYFVLVRSDVALWRGVELDQVATRFSRVGLGPCRASVASRMLHNTSPIVQQWLEKARRRRASAAAGVIRRTFKWQQLHTKARVASAASRGTSQITVEGLSERSQSVLGILLNGAGLTSLMPDTNVDLSQNLGRARLSVKCPTVTPGSAILVGELGRLLVPMEKCLVHLVPLHKLVLPVDVSDTEFGNLGGNTMHLMAVRGSGFV